MDSQVAASSYPTSLTGSLDPGVSRWLWLVKWLLAIPHVVAPPCSLDRGEGPHLRRGAGHPGDRPVPKADL